MNRRPVRPAELVPFLLGGAVVVLLTWASVRIDRHALLVVPVTAPAEPARRPPPPGATVAAAPAPATAPGRPGPAGASADGPPNALSIPVAGVDPKALEGTFAQSRGGTRSHEALDILAPRGTPVLAADDGVVKKLFTSVRGGLTVYQFDLEERYCYYYAHLDGYAPSLHEGQLLRRGDLVGYVGSTGNARADAPHLHFAVTRLDADRKWWGGTPVDPYPLLVRAP